MLISLLRSMILYTLLILVIRAMGKRQIGQMEASEFVVTMLIADLASVPMQNNAISLFSGLVPILAVLALELILSVASMKLLGVRRLLCGRPVILIEHGRICESNLRRTRVTLEELACQLRISGPHGVIQRKSQGLDQVGVVLSAEGQPVHGQVAIAGGVFHRSAAVKYGECVGRQP